MGKHQLNPETWVDKYSDQMLGYTVTRVRDRAVAKDLVQEAFFVALRSKDKYRGELAEKNWLYLILRSRILDYYKKKKEVLESQMSRSEEDEDSDFMENGSWNQERAPQEWAPDKMLESEEFMEILTKCTSNLNDMQSAVFTMKYIDGEDSEDICKELNITSSNYWVLVHRAKLRLRKCLEVNWMS